MQKSCSESNLLTLQHLFATSQSQQKNPLFFFDILFESGTHNLQYNLYLRVFNSHGSPTREITEGTMTLPEIS